MKQIIILLVAVMFLSGCGESSGEKVVSTNPVDSSGRPIEKAPDNGRNDESILTPVGLDVTPLAYGESLIFPEAQIQLGFQVGINGVFSQGEIRLLETFGYLNCELPVGTYTLITSIPGQKIITPGYSEPIVHNYGGVTLSATGPVLFTAVLTRSLSRQNPNGEWVMDAELKLKSVKGATCSNPIPISFGMPSNLD